MLGRNGLSFFPDEALGGVGGLSLKKNTIIKATTEQIIAWQSKL